MAWTSSLSIFWMAVLLSGACYLSSCLAPDPPSTLISFVFRLVPGKTRKEVSIERQKEHEKCARWGKNRPVSARILPTASGQGSNEYRLFPFPFLAVFGNLSTAVHIWLIERWTKRCLSQMCPSSAQGNSVGARWGRVVQACASRQLFHQHDSLLVNPWPGVQSPARTLVKVLITKRFHQRAKHTINNHARW